MGKNPLCWLKMNYFSNIIYSACMGQRDSVNSFNLHNNWIMYKPGSFLLFSWKFWVLAKLPSWVSRKVSFLPQTFLIALETTLLGTMLPHLLTVPAEADMHKPKPHPSSDPPGEFRFMQASNWSGRWHSWLHPLNSMTIHQKGHEKWRGYLGQQLRCHYLILEYLVSNPGSGPNPGLLQLHTLGISKW